MLDRPFHITLLAAFWLLFIGGCAHSPNTPSNQISLYLSPAPASINTSDTPAFLIREPSQPFNKIGTPSVRAGTGKVPEIYVDPDKPAVYFEAQEFTTLKGSYTNLIYRIHFQEVPLGWTSINLTAGHNPGILLIYTLNEAGNLILVTTVHTCGCYLAFLPTEAMPRDALPSDWPLDPQSVNGYSLPSRLSLPREKSGGRLTFTLESETHRISDVFITDDMIRRTIPHQVKMQLRPMYDLFSLPYRDGTLSFFETEGSRLGYVKDNTKILERLFMGWWAFDFQIGEDKAYSIHDKSETIFYTSLKFWARKASNLKNYPEFLSYWGWKL